MLRTTGFLLAVAFAVGCASTPATKPVDMSEPRRILGTESGVRLDAFVYQDQLAESVSVPISYDVTNHRSSTIAIADLIPAAAYDAETQTVTITLGSEVPGETFLPRLIAIKPEEKKSFSSVAHVSLVAHPGTPWQPRPRQIVLKLNFLTDATPFEQLVALHEKALYDPKLAADLFPKWVDGNETIVTNSLPMRWNGASVQDTPMAPIQTQGRGGRRSDRP